MDYFMLEQDRNLKSQLTIEGFDAIRPITFTDEEIGRITDLTLLKCSGLKESVFPDFFSFPVLFVSDKLREVFTSYDQSLLFKKCYLISDNLDLQEKYHLLLMKNTDFTHKITTYHKNKWIKDLVVDKQVMKGRSICYMPTTSKNYLIISLPLAESILRRDPQGIIINPVASM